MTRILLVVVLYLNATAALAQGDATTPTPPVVAQESAVEASTKVVVQIVNATVGPCKVGGANWDGMGKLNPTVSSGIAQLVMGTNPYTGVVSLLGGPLASGTDKPDPFGAADLAIGGEYKPEMRHSFFASKGALTKDTFTPTFPPFEWKDVPLNAGTRIRVTLWDKDLMEDDPIGVAELNAKDLLAALQAEKVHQVLVADQTQNQLLFIGISVRPTK